MTDGDRKRLSVDDLLASDVRGSREVYIPEMGGYVTVQGISGKLKWEFEAAVMKGRDAGDYSDMAKMQSRIVAEAVGADRSQYAALSQLDAAVLDRIRDAALNVSGMDDDDVEDFG